MKVYIHTDIEGVAGFVFYQDRRTNTLFNYEHIRRMNALFTAEVASAVRACVDAGADEIYINDNHGYCYSLDFEELDGPCRIINGRAGRAPGWLPELDGTFDAAIGIGMHAMAGTPGAVCPHSCWHLTDGTGCEIKLSECSMFAALAGTVFDVPVVAISGDDKIAAEMQFKIPSCRAAVVKKGLGPQNACSLVPKRARKLIYETVLEALEHRGEILPYKLTGPFKLNVSDRDPAVRALAEDRTGNDLWQLMHETCRCFGNDWGAREIDDGSWRYPRDVFGR